MSDSRRGAWWRIAAGVALAIAALLTVTGEAKAAKYAVAQCGWHIGADADWADTTGGVKFRPDSYCAAPPASDPFDGVHLKSFTRAGQATVSGTRYARWRWTAPPGTGIVNVRGTWWHALHDGMEQRLGVGQWGGGFDVFAAASQTDTTLRDFAAGFATPRPYFEDRLLCARLEKNHCSLDPGSWSGVRALTITLEDDSAPAATVGGDLAAGGWRRGVQGIQFSGSDSGGGVRFAETLLDGARVGLTEYPCAKAMIGGEWRATRMRPCELGASGAQTVDTRAFSDGPHALGHCESDFAGNVGCIATRTVLIDNNPPAHPRPVSLAGGDGWRRTDDFDLTWGNPDQGPASPIAGAAWRITGPGDFDTGRQFAGGRDLTALSDLKVPRAGSYSLALWLRDEAGNEDPGTAVTVPLRFDDVPPGVSFAVGSDPLRDGVVKAGVGDSHSGPAGGAISYRRSDSSGWIELPTKLDPGADPGGATLVARLPERLGPGSYLFRAQAADAAGNVAATTRRADGSEMAVTKAEPAKSRPAPRGRSSAKRRRAKTRIFARLRWGRRQGRAVTVPFGKRARLSGRLVRADGRGLARRMVRIVSRPSHGALGGVAVRRVRTGRGGGFAVALRAGPSRRITVTFPGNRSLQRSRRPSLALRVRGSLTLHIAPRSLRTGRAIQMRGRVRTLGAPLPRRGKLVALQYYESATRRWRPIMVARTDHSGRYRAHYRFRYVRGTALIRLRALALAENGWPYAPGASRGVTVRVRG